MSCLITVGLFSVIFFLYILPTIIVAYYNVDETSGMYVSLINICFGWTVVGWVVALIMAIYIVVVRPKNKSS